MHLAGCAGCGALIPRRPFSWCRQCLYSDPRAVAAVGAQRRELEEQQRKEALEQLEAGEQRRAEEQQRLKAAMQQQLLDAERAHRRRVREAHVAANERRLAAEEEGAKSVPRLRRPLTKQVKHAVWQRDQGRCVDCGSREHLEYDHIIPFSRGGSDTERNLQLLCAPCNRSKGSQI